MKQILLIFAFLLTATVVNAKVIYYQVTEVNLRPDKHWQGWKKNDITIGLDNVDEILVLYTEEQQRYKLTYSEKTTDNVNKVVSYVYSAKDQEGYTACIIFSLSSDGQCYITIGYPDYTVMYHVYQKRK